MSREAVVSDYFQKSERRHPAAILIEQAVPHNSSQPQTFTPGCLKGNQGEKKKKKKKKKLMDLY